MPETADTSNPPDICLLLRLHAEQSWLIGEVVPVLRQVERPGSIPEEQLGAALAYLEMLWMQARRLAAETDHAREQLDPGSCSRVLYEKARRYQAAVRRLRDAVDLRIARATSPHVASDCRQHAAS